MNLGGPASIALDLNVCSYEIYIESVVTVLILIGGGEDLVPDARVTAALRGEGVSHVDIIATAGLVNILVWLVIRIAVGAENEAVHL